MKKFAKTCAVLAAFVAAPAFASDPANVLPNAGDDIETYRAFGAWTVMKNNTDKHCFAYRADDAGNIIQMGLTRDGQYGYLGAFTTDGRLAGEGAEIVALLNGNLYSGEAQGVTSGLSGGHTGGYILVNNTNFVRDLEAATKIEFFPDTPYVVTLNVKRARDAVYEARKCMEEM